ncbi:MAG: hypothetical protein JJV93_03285 [Alphaproteobacteria bacterium]|nr:hypothetical protein [Alphaproteobacteria bacterium]
MINSRDISVVVQGAIDDRYTLYSLESIRNYLPEATIILSTWEGSDVSLLDDTYDEIIFNKDPGCTPHSKKKGGKLNNINRQIVSTMSGIELSKTKYILKMRTDFYLTGNSFLKYFNKYNIFTEKFRKVKHRILSCSLYARNPEEKNTPFPFHPSDFVFFGLREDIRNLFNIPLMSKKDSSYFLHKKATGIRKNFNLIYRYHPEQHLWINFLKYKSCDYFADVNDKIIEDTKISFANNLVILSPKQLNIGSLKRGIFSNNPDCCYTYYDWIKMYYKYSLEDKKVPLRFSFKRYILLSRKIVKRYIKALPKFLFRIKIGEKKVIIKVMKIPVYHTKYKKILLKLLGR